MFSFLITIISALIISIIGAYFSIIGLSTIFPGSELSVIIMGSALEVAKIVTVLWLHKNWSRSKFLLKSYLCFAVVVLMGITSLGIFGFLSKAHIEHQSLADKEMTMIENFNFKIKKENDLINQYENYIKNINEKNKVFDGKFDKEKDREEQKLNMLTEKLKNDIQFEDNKIKEFQKQREDLKKELKQLEESSGGLFSNKKKKIEELKDKQAPIITSIENSINKHNSLIENYRKKYNEEFKKIEDKIEEFRERDFSGGEDGQEKIEQYNQKIRSSMDLIQEMEIEKSKYGDKIKEIESEIGPLKYFIGLIADATGKEIKNGQAVRLIIIVIMIVFDPLAILLVVAAQTSYYQSKEKFNTTYTKLRRKIKTEDECAKSEKTDDVNFPTIKKDKMTFLLEPNQNSNSSSKEE
ncbi:hypothetical protein OAR09_00375 [bacterium]|nr:hypothetical protein [bacterium]